VAYGVPFSPDIVFCFTGQIDIPPPPALVFGIIGIRLVCFTCHSFLPHFVCFDPLCQITGRHGVFSRSSVSGFCLERFFFFHFLSLFRSLRISCVFSLMKFDFCTPSRHTVGLTSFKLSVIRSRFGSHWPFSSVSLFNSKFPWFGVLGHRCPAYVYATRPPSFSLQSEAMSLNVEAAAFIWCDFLISDEVCNRYSACPHSIFSMVMFFSAASVQWAHSRVGIHPNSF